MAPLIGAPRRRGIVLVAVVLLLLAVTLVTHGVLMVARSYRQGGMEIWEAVQVRRSVVGRVAAAATSGDSTATGWRPTGSLVEVRVVPDPLSPEVTLWRGAGRSQVARWWAGSLTWRPHPISRGLLLRAAAEIGGSLRVAGGRPLVTSSDGSGCAADAAPPALGPLDRAGLHLGPLSVDGLAARLPGWAPTASAGGGACGAASCPPQLGRSDGPLVIAGGSHRGLFLVRGDLTLSDSAWVRGMLLVEGSLTLLRGAGVRGAVQVLGDLVSDGSGALAGDPCAITDIWADGLRHRLGPVVLDGRPWALWQPSP